MKKYVWYNYTASWIDLIDGIIGIVTFGFYRPYWDFDLLAWHSKRMLKKRIATQDKVLSEKGSKV